MFQTPNGLPPDTGTRERTPPGERRPDAVTPCRFSGRPREEKPHRFPEARRPGLR